MKRRFTIIGKDKKKYSDSYSVSCTVEVCSTGELTRDDIDRKVSALKNQFFDVLKNQRYAVDEIKFIRAKK